ncbi:rhomboid family intramembrane serine protease [Bifidobacterium goeldii]|nr:rhomboid family intramembrane serine protease [Bifidobacterium goeldii]
MSNGRFSLFPGSPSLRSIFSKRSIRNQWNAGGPVITGAIIVACVAIWVLEMLLSLVWPTGLNILVGYGRLAPLTAVREPWTFITSMFLHAPNTILHILFNMFALWSVGPMLERMMGHWPFLALYTLSGLGGGLGMMAWAAIHPTSLEAWYTGAYGASGALFGLFAAMLVVYRRIGEDIRSMLIWMAVNFLLPLVVGGIAWQAHVGGFLVGGAMTALLTAGLPAFRSKSLAWRTVVYGLALFAAIVVLIALCNQFNPLLSVGL